MVYKTKNTYKNENHPWEPYIPEKANKLILGTFSTSERNRGSYEFFYPNPNNEFWKILFAVAGQNLADYSKKDPVEIRKQVMKKLQLGIADMGKTILRQRGNSSDANLFPVEFTDIFQLLDKHKKITTIIVTSSSGSNSVLSWLHQYCNLNEYNFKVPEGTLPKSTSFDFQDRKITIKIIPSPSGQSRIKGIARIEMYKQAIN
jgi:G:T/U-mismatch repair DNA glycosylase